jgi:hypothetical protein
MDDDGMDGWVDGGGWRWEGDGDGDGDGKEKRKGACRVFSLWWRGTKVMQRSAGGSPSSISDGANSSTPKTTEGLRTKRLSLVPADTRHNGLHNYLKSSRQAQLARVAVRLGQIGHAITVRQSLLLT